ncbi:MAG: TonB-dependent receptor [Vicinamibacteria bacterium]|nr:TonB-dependent receptor [Vicinamibacteria bacterium]
MPWLLCAMGAVSLLSAHRLSAETAAGTLSGKITDPVTHAPLAGVTVSVRELHRQVESNAQGQYTLADLPAGVYTLHFKSASFIELVRPDTVIRPARLTELSVELARAPRYRGEVSVVASYFADNDTAPTGTFLLGAEEIRRAPGTANDLSRALYVLPGVTQADDDSNELIVRGGSPAENGFFVDGVLMPNINFFPQEGASGGRLGILNIDFIKEVEVHTGGFDARYGNRLSAVVDIRLRAGNHRERDGQLDLNVAGFSGGIEGPLLARRGSYMLSLRRSYLDLFTRAFDIVGMPRFGDAQGKIGVDFSPRQRLSALLVLADSRFDRAHQEALEAGQSEGHEQYNQSVVGAIWRALWGQKLFSETSLSYTRVSGYSAWHDPLVAFDSSVTDYHEEGLTLRNDNVWQWGRSQRLTLGLFARGARARGADDHLPAPLRVDGLERAAFVSQTAQLWSRLKLTLGVRGERLAFGRRAHVSPRAAFEWMPLRGLRLTGAAGVYHQELPLFLREQSAANHALHDPRAVHTVAGVSFDLAPQTRLTIETYNKDYRFMPMAPKNPTRFIIDDVTGDHTDFNFYGALADGGRARARGVEVILQRKMSGNHYEVASASYGRNRYRDLKGVWHDRIHDNRYVFNLVSGHRLGRGWEVSARWVIAGGNVETPVDLAKSIKANGTVRDSARFMAEHLPAYHSLNLRADRRFSFQSTNLVAYLSLWNAYAHQNIRTRYYSRATGGIVEEQQWPLLPLFGLEFEF